VYEDRRFEGGDRGRFDRLGDTIRSPSTQFIDLLVGLEGEGLRHVEGRGEEGGRQIGDVPARRGRGVPARRRGGVGPAEQVGRKLREGGGGGAVQGHRAEGEGGVGGGHSRPR